MPHSSEVPLSPTLFLDRAKSAFADRTAIVDGDRRFTYREFLDRSRRLAGALNVAGIRPGDRVAALSVNSHVMFELHNGVPIAGAVLVPLNIRLAVAEIVSIVEHSGASVLVATAECGDAARAVAERCGISLWLEGSSDGEYEERLQVASVEVERILLDHEAVLETAVVGRSDEFWGEVPVAFVTLKPGRAATEAELIEFVRGRIAHFKAPRAIWFQDLPKTSTGKVQKHLLRMRINEPSHA